MTLKDIIPPETAWPYILKEMLKREDLNERAIIIQSGIAEFGPIPDRLAEPFREALKPTAS